MSPQRKNKKKPNWKVQRQVVTCGLLFLCCIHQSIVDYFFALNLHLMVVPIALIVTTTQNQIKLSFPPFSILNQINNEIINLFFFFFLNFPLRYLWLYYHYIYRASMEQGRTPELPRRTAWGCEGVWISIGETWTREVFKTSFKLPGITIYSNHLYVFDT